jgi:GDP-L-fucose synthase
MKILITGGNGYIAKLLNCFFKYKYKVYSISRYNFDLTDYKKTCEWFDGKTFDVVIHTAIGGGSRLQLDDSSVFDKNMAMFNNLVANQKCFSKLISFGSGAEIFHGDTPYANSKREIAKQILQHPNFYNLRIFGVFDENELDTRFIKSNLIRYIKKEPLSIHSNKIMDFFYMKDLLSLVQYYIENDNVEKTVNCSYETKKTLVNIANFINNLSDYTVPINIQNKNTLDFYCGDSNLPIKTIGLEDGIIDTYKILKKNIGI